MCQNWFPLGVEELLLETHKLETLDGEILRTISSFSLHVVYHVFFFPASESRIVIGFIHNDLIPIFYPMLTYFANFPDCYYNC